MTPTALDPARVSSRMVRAGRKIHEQGRVHHLPDGHLYVVEGDTLDEDGHPVLYMAGYDPTYGISDTCPAHGPCKHREALRREVQANPPVHGDAQRLRQTLASDGFLDAVLDDLTERAGLPRGTDALNVARWDLKAALAKALDAHRRPGAEPAHQLRPAKES